MMADDLHGVREMRRAVSVVEKKAFGLPGRQQRQRKVEVPVVIAREDDQFAISPQSFHEAACLAGRGSVVNHIPDDDQLSRLIFRHQLVESRFHRGHTPHRHEPPGCPLAEFISEVQIGDSQPALRSVEKSKSAVEQNVIRNESLVRLEDRHGKRQARKLWLASCSFNRY